MKRILVYTLPILLVFACFGKTFAQSVNDCSGATLISSGDCTSFTTTGGNGGSSSCGSGNNYHNTWYRFVGNGGLMEVIVSDANRNVSLSIHSSCSSGSIDCMSISTNTSGTLYIQTTSGTTYYVRIQRRSGGSSGDLSGTLCVQNHTPTPQECEGSIYVCSNESFSGNSAGHGFQQELNSSNRGCLSTNEHQTSWYYITVEQGGIIEMTIDPRFNDDYDFAIWGPFTSETANNNCPPVTAPLRCSYADNGHSGWNNGGQAIGYPTGLRTGHPESSEAAYGGADGFVAPINANTGDVYILVIDNFSTSNRGFDLEWGGTAVLGCETPIVLSVELVFFTGEDLGRRNSLKWKTASEINNHYFDVEKSTDGLIWEHVGRVEGNGTTKEEHSYQIIDETVERTVNYYRLNQIDFDGQKTTHNIILIDNSTEKKQLLKTVNSIGQEVDQNQKGMVIFIYSDGTVVKKVQ